MKAKLKPLLCGALVLILLGACSHTPTNFRSPAGAKVVDSSGNTIGNTPITMDVLCGPPLGLRTLMIMTIVLAPVAIMSHEPESNFDITLNEQILKNAGLNSNEISEVMSAGNTIQTSFITSCPDAAKFELDDKTIRAVLLDGESATYRWNAAGGGVVVATMRRKK